MGVFGLKFLREMSPYLVVLGYSRGLKQLWPYFCNFWVSDLLGSMSMMDINILLSYRLNIKHFNMVLNLGFVFICTISDDKLMQIISYFV